MAYIHVDHPFLQGRNTVKGLIVMTNEWYCLSRTQPTMTPVFLCELSAVRRHWLFWLLSVEHCFHVGCDECKTEADAKEKGDEFGSEGKENWIKLNDGSPFHT